MKFNRDMLLLYAITDRAWTGKKSFYKQIEDALKGGATILQLREKNLSEDEFVKEAAEVKKICRSYGVPLIINDCAQVALKVGADGVHLGIDDAPVKEIRKISGGDFIIGATAKTVEQAKYAEKTGATYIGVGAVFPSPTKKKAIRITKDRLREICGAVSIPAVAIGGISLENINELKGAGVDGVAVVSALFGAENVESAAKELRRKAKEIIL